MPHGESKQIEWVLDGRRVSSPAGTTILEGARAHGVSIPHFCYHPGLAIAGNCRICLVQTNRSPKPVISCSERISQDLEVMTQSPMAVEAREGVMEFQLINHPLDCPVCDKAGECVLQDYSFDHGPDRSRFLDPKNIRHTKRLGPTIEIWGNRCIVCTRCVRFCDEISGTGELCVVERGDRSVVDVFPGVPIDNALAGNVIDICPVGALIGSDFKFEARVWYMDKTQSICAGCARGCNIEVHALDGYLKRLVPRENAAVNEWWMCDYGRYDWRYAHADERVRACHREGVAIADEKALEGAAGALRAAAAAGERVAFIVDPFLTCEELHLVQSLARRFQNALTAGWLPPPGRAERFPKGFTISAEKAPNRRGAEAILGADLFGAAQRRVQEALQSGQVSLAVVFAGFPHADPPMEWRTALRGARARIAFSLFDGFWSAGAAYLFPAASPFEKEGTWVNEDGRLQRVRSAAKPSTAFPGTTSVQGTPRTALSARSELQLLQELLVRLGERQRVLSAAGVFRELAEESAAFRGLSHRAIPAVGVPFAGAAREQAAAAAQGGAH